MDLISQVIWPSFIVIITTVISIKYNRIFESFTSGRSLFLFVTLCIDVNRYYFLQLLCIPSTNIIQTVGLVPNRGSL